MLCHGLIKRGHAFAGGGRMLFCHLRAKWASPKELKQMPQICNFEAPDLAAWASALFALNHTNFSRALAARRSMCEQSTA